MQTAVSQVPCSELCHRQRVRRNTCRLSLFNADHPRALYHANTYVKSGVVECALALGFEQMSAGSLKPNFTDRPPPLAVFNDVSHDIEEHQGGNSGPMGKEGRSQQNRRQSSCIRIAPRMFSNAAQEYFDTYGASKNHLAMIAAKNHKHSTKNPYSQFRNGWSVDEVHIAPHIHGQDSAPMRKCRSSRLPT